MASGETLGKLCAAEQVWFLREGTARTRSWHKGTHKLKPGNRELSPGHGRSAQPLPASPRPPLGRAPLTDRRPRAVCEGGNEEVLRVHQDVVLWFRSHLTSSRRVGMFADRGCGSTFASGDAEPIVDVHGASSAWSSGSAASGAH